MSRARILAPVSLLIAALLFAATLPFTHLFPFALLHAFAEAAMIGGLADWFAVVALFRHPMGLPIPHTAIIPKYRAKITRSIIDIVQNKWLDKETIRERVGSLRLSDAFVRSMRSEGSRDSLLRAVRTVLHELVSGADADAVASRAITVANERLTPDAVLLWLKTAGETALDRGWHVRLRDVVLRHGAVWINEPRVQTRIAQNLEKIADDYATTLRRKVARVIAEVTDTLNYDDLSRAITMTIRDEITAMGNSDGHPLNAEFERATRDFVSGLESNEEVRALLEERLRELFSSERPDEFTHRTLQRVKEWLLRDLESDDSLLLLHAGTFFDDWLTRFEKDPTAQERVDSWLRERIVNLVEQHHDEIGRMVQHNLEKLDDEQLVTQIEEKVGGDLQYIRVNGALVGGMVGAAIFLMKTLL